MRHGHQCFPQFGAELGFAGAPPSAVDAGTLDQARGGRGAVERALDRCGPDLSSDSAGCVRTNSDTQRPEERADVRYGSLADPRLSAGLQLSAIRARASGTASVG